MPSPKRKISNSLSAMIFSLVGVSVFSGLMLGFVYEQTKAPIQAAQNHMELEAITDIIGSDYDNNPFEDKTYIYDDNGNKLEFYPARKDGQIKAFAIKTFSNKAFGGKLELIAGFGINGKILGYKVVNSQETPGLGTKVSEADFAEQFRGLRPQSPAFNVRQDGGEIDAVTSATISSRAVIDAIRKAYNAYRKLSSGDKHE